eukprot:466919_1
MTTEPREKIDIDNNNMEQTMYDVLKTNHPVYARHLQTRGCDAVRDGLVERSAALGIVSALVGSMVFAIIVDPPQLENENLLKSAQCFFVMSFGLCFINISTTTHHIAVLTTLLTSDEQIIHFLNEFGSYIGLPDTLIGVAAFFLLTGTLFIVYDLYGIAVGIFSYVFLFGIFSYWIWEQQREVAFILKKPNATLKWSLLGFFWILGAIVVTLCIVFDEDI